MAELLGDEKSLDKFSDYDLSFSDNSLFNDIVLRIESVEEDQDDVILVMSEVEGKKLLNQLKKVVEDESG